MALVFPLLLPLVCSSLGGLISERHYAGMGSTHLVHRAVLPVQVPEYEIFSVIENQRRAIVQWMDEHPDQANVVLRKAVSIGFHVHLQEESGATTWSKIAPGVYHEEHMRVTVDLQSGEILSNRQETRPVRPARSLAHPTLRHSVKCLGSPLLTAVCCMMSCRCRTACRNSGTSRPSSAMRRFGALS